MSLQIVLFLKLNATFLMFQNKTKLQRGVFVWMVERAGNKYVFSSSFSPSLKRTKNLSIRIVRGATPVHILDTNCSAFYKHYYFLPVAVLTTKTNDMIQR